MKGPDGMAEPIVAQAILFIMAVVMHNTSCNHHQLHLILL